MANKWYPVIDITTCIECGTCSEFCQHSVYDKSKAPTPKVINPEKCIDRCHDCGNQCPVGAISYVGDETGWIPPVLRTEDRAIDAQNMSCGCSCGGKC